MKNLLKVASVLLLTNTLLVSISSCKKDDDKGLPPNMAFKTAAGYTSADAAVAKNTVVLMGINASKSEGNDILTKATITVAYDGGADSVLVNETVPSAQADAYSKDYSATTRNVAGKEKYTFTVVSKDGVKNSQSITLTVQ